MSRWNICNPIADRIFYLPDAVGHNHYYGQNTSLFAQQVEHVGCHMNSLLPNGAEFSAGSIPQQAGVSTPALENPARLAEVPV